MATKHKKQFGVWMDGEHATIVGRSDNDAGEFVVLAHERNPSQGGNSNENTANNLERTTQLQFFKKIASHMQNIDELHVTGTGQTQEQFIHFLEQTPQYKSTKSVHSTAQKMDDKKLIDYISGKFR